MVNVGVELCGKWVFLFGVGGVVCGVFEFFFGECLVELLIVNCMVWKVVDLVEWFVDFGVVYGCGFVEVEGFFDLIVNGILVSFVGDVLLLVQSVIEFGCIVCYDMMYVKELIVFNCWVVECGVVCILDGLGMLVEQVVEVFFFWCGVCFVLVLVLEMLC